MNAPTPAADPAGSTGTSIAEYSKTDAALAELKKSYAAIVYDFTKQGEMAKALKDRAAVRSYRLDLEKVRVDIKAVHLEKCRQIDSEAKRITHELAALEDPIDAQIKREEGRKEEERRAKEEAEAKRVAEITARIDAVNAIPTSVVGRSPADILTVLDQLRERVIPADEYQATADNAKLRAIAALEQLHAGAVAQEKAAAEEAARRRAADEELAKLRAESEQRAREDDARQKAESERIAAENKRIAEERAKVEAEDRARRAKIEEEERASRAKMEAEEREARQKREAEDRTAREARDAEAKKAKEEQDARDAVEREARLKREAEDKRLQDERRELERKAAEVLDARQILAKFKERFGHIAEFKGVVKAIDALPVAQQQEAA